MVFLAYAKTGFPPKTTSHWHHRFAQPTSKYAVLSPGSSDAFTDSLESVQKLRSIITSRATIVAGAA